MATQYKYGQIRPWAGYEVEFNKRGPEWILYKIYPFDCYGRGVPEDGSWRWLNTWPPVKGKVVDIRSLKALTDGCCPPQVGEEQIRKERFEDQDKDAAMEALRMHKRGYFGGGG